MQIDETTRKNIAMWLNANDDKEEIDDLEKNDPDALINAFYKTLDFGTGGLRGLMGIGTNRVNAFTIKTATQAFCNYLKKNANSAQKVFIGYDTRLNSSTLAKQVAQVFAGNGMTAYLSESFIPTPLVSFACRFLNCSGAIMITASHNTANYNGFKVYWRDGAQVRFPHDEDIISEFKKVSATNEIHETTNLDHPKIIKIGKDIVDAYLENLKKMEFFPELIKTQGSKLKIAYSSLHGTGIHIVPQVLKSWGFDQIVIVKEQASTDGKFSTVDYPNPEAPQTLKLGIETMLSTGSDLLFVTDPDADRLGVVVNDHGNPLILSGNEIACLCFHFLCEVSEKRKVINPAIIKSIVTTELLQAIANSYFVTCFNVIPGFKYIAQLIEEWGNENSYHFLFGCEESLGYLFCDFVRDKDAVSTCNLLASIALLAKTQDKTLKDLLNELYLHYGVYQQVVESIHFQESKEGHEKMQESMNKFIDLLPESIGGKKIVVLENYQKSLRKNLITQEETLIPLPKSEVFIFYLEDDTKIMIRPSGTEPKIKVYCETYMKVDRSIIQTQEVCLGLAKERIKQVFSMLNEK